MFHLSFPTLTRLNHPVQILSVEEKTAAHFDTGNFSSPSPGIHCALLHAQILGGVLNTNQSLLGPKNGHKNPALYRINCRFDCLGWTLAFGGNFRGLLSHSQPLTDKHWNPASSMSTHELPLIISPIRGCPKFVNGRPWLFAPELQMLLGDIVRLE